MLRLGARVAGSEIKAAFAPSRRAFGAVPTKVRVSTTMLPPNPKAWAGLCPAIEEPGREQRPGRWGSLRAGRPALP